MWILHLYVCLTVMSGGFFEDQALNKISVVWINKVDNSHPFSARSSKFADFFSEAVKQFLYTIYSTICPNRWNRWPSRKSIRPLQLNSNLSLCRFLTSHTLLVTCSKILVWSILFICPPRQCRMENVLFFVLNKFDCECVDAIIGLNLKYMRAGKSFMSVCIS